MKMADERIRAGQQSHDLEISNLINNWEER
jgi:hypothetical protein